MFFDFNEQFELKDCYFEIDNNGQISHQRVQAPKMVIIQQFLSLLQQAINVTAPVKIKLGTMVQVYSEKLNIYRDMESTIEFKNNACLDKEQSK